jgi:hypothetical protein
MNRIYHKEAQAAQPPSSLSVGRSCVVGPYPPTTMNSSPPPSGPLTPPSEPKPRPRPDLNIQRDNSQYFQPGVSEIYRSWNARTLPERAHLPKIDERCLFYCTQSVEDRYRTKRPVCYTLCWRRAFPHESHQMAKTPQALTWSDYWSLDSRTRPESHSAKEWAPLAGRYIYFSRGRYVATRHMFGMKGSGVPSPVNYVPGTGDDPPVPLNGKAAAPSEAERAGKTASRGAPPLQPE